MPEFEKLEQDLSAAWKCELPEDLDRLGLVPSGMTNGDRLWWYYKDDDDLRKEFGEPSLSECEPPDWWPYSGVAVLRPGMDMGSCNEEAECWVIVIDRYPTEKCSPDTEWVALARLINNPDLLEMRVARPSGEIGGGDASV